MIAIHVRLYEELNRVLPDTERKKTVARRLFPGAKLNDLLDVMGLRQAEIDLVLVNSQSVDFEYLLQDEDMVSLYPEFESLDIHSVSALPERPLRKPRFIAQSNLSSLSNLLGQRGYDCLCPPQASEDALASISKQEKRILLTHNPSLAVTHDLDRCFCLHSEEPQEQLWEVKERFQLR
ncbi:MAG: Mut7-C RNAse domain-containing protein [Desulfovermiculus sp.]|nr:Mut7-C RNAse domain-containing protein [Desulfovermiculus sp.]